jgi:hypothetical protein
MNNSFIISPEAMKVKIPESFSTIARNNQYCLFASPDSIESYGDVSILVNGHPMPRNNSYSEYKSVKGGQLVHDLFIRYGIEFIRKIKGFFLIVICTKENFYIYTDIHSVKRFYYKTGDLQNIISNDLDLLVKNIPTITDENIAIHQALFQHLLFGQTQYKNIRYAEYASFATLGASGLCVHKYWSAGELLNCDKNCSIEEFIAVFNKTISNSIGFFKPGNIGITLTGGRDTRSVLASLINNSISPHAFTFGNPRNRDVIVGKSIAQACGLTFSNPWMEEPCLANYKLLTDEIINDRNPFVHIHRAHRLDAIKKVTSKHKIDMLFLGAMGGDYIKGTAFDNYIVSTFMARFFFDKRVGQEALIKEILNSHAVKYNEDQIRILMDSMHQNEIFKDQHLTSEKDLLIVHEIIGCTHDIQDITVYANYVPILMAPFMDMDIMEALFHTRYSLINNSKNSMNPFVRYLGGELQAKLIVSLCPALKNIPFASYYTPADAAGYKVKYIIKRGLAAYKHHQSPNVSGFPYSEWFRNFVQHEFIELHDSVKIQYNVHVLKEWLDHNTHLEEEGYWHKFTNPIMLSSYVSILNKGQ